MNTVQHNNESINVACPVPFKQQPVWEYWYLRKRQFYRWAILSPSKYITKLIAVWIAALLLVLLVIAWRSPVNTLRPMDLLLGAFVAELVVGIVLARLYAAWHYVHLRLVQREIDYQVLTTDRTKLWRKSELVSERDRLVARFQVRPTLQRIERSILFLVIIASSNLLILFVTTNY